MEYPPQRSSCSSVQSHLSGIYSGEFRSSYRRAEVIERELQPVLARIREYDAERLRLEKRGGDLRDLARITEIMKNPVTVQTLYGSTILSLADQQRLQSAISAIDCDLHLEVRQLQTMMPVYYLSRLNRDFWSEYRLIVEDLYMSPGFPLHDERFVKLMKFGHEVYHLRLSQFRPGVARIAAVNPGDSAARIDLILMDLGRNIFQAAWHDDQRLGMSAAVEWGLPEFRQTIELLYLCLSGELCELRSMINPDMKRFFEEVYPHPPIRSLLEQLPGLDGERLTELPRQAAILYRELSLAFTRFLSSEIAWGWQRRPLPLWKILYANFSRLALAGKELRDEATFIHGAGSLEEESHRVVRKILACGDSIHAGGN